MGTVEITGENAEEFAGLISEDLCEDLSRAFFRGIGVVDENEKPLGAFVYELKNYESEDNTTSMIRLVKGESTEVTRALCDSYLTSAEEDEVTKSFYETTDETEADALHDAGFSKQPAESRKVTIFASDLKDLPIKTNIRIPDHIQSLGELSVVQYRNGIKNFLFKGLKGSLEDLAYLPLGWFEKEVSSCSVTDGKVDGLLLVRKTPSGELHALLYAAYGPDYVRTLPYLLLYSVQKLQELYPPDTKIVINRHTKEVAALTAKLTGGRKGEAVFAGSREA